VNLRTTLAAGLTATALLLSGCGGDDQPFKGVVLDQPYQIDGTALTDTGGQPYSLTKDTDARLTLVFFGYTHCPDICGIVMSSLASAVTRLDDADRKQVQVVFVTTDPARDDEQTLRHYLDSYNPDFVGLTGSLEDIITVGDSVHVPIEKGQKLPSGGYEVVHGTSVVGIDHSDEVPVVWTEGTSAAQYAADIHSLLGRPR
jgi:protein SCO1/2